MTTKSLAKTVVRPPRPRRWCAGGLTLTALFSCTPVTSTPQNESVGESGRSSHVPLALISLIRVAALEGAASGDRDALLENGWPSVDAKSFEEAGVDAGHLHNYVDKWPRQNRLIARNILTRAALDVRLTHALFVDAFSGSSHFVLSFRHIGFLPSLAAARLLPTPFRAVNGLLWESREVVEAMAKNWRSPLTALEIDRMRQKAAHLFGLREWPWVEEFLFSPVFPSRSGLSIRPSSGRQEIIFGPCLSPEEYQYVVLHELLHRPLELFMQRISFRLSIWKTRSRFDEVQASPLRMPGYDTWFVYLTENIVACMADQLLGEADFRPPMYFDSLVSDELNGHTDEGGRVDIDGFLIDLFRHLKREGRSPRRRS